MDFKTASWAFNRHVLKQWSFCAPVAESKNKAPIVGISGFRDSARNDGGTGLAQE